jgi:hypothetical protein
VKWAISFLGVLTSLLLAGHARASGSLCEELEKFAKDQEAERANPMRRHWVEFHWGIDPDPNTFWSWGCRHSDDSFSKQFCGYLMENTSREFRNTLPIRVLKCWGYRFPKDAGHGWHVGEGHFTHERKNGSWLVMDIASFNLQQGELAVRFSYDTVDRRLDPDDLEPIQPLREGNEIRLP